MQKFFYHYTSKRNIQSILDGLDYGRAELLPMRRFIPYGGAKDMPEDARESAVFGLLDPLDKGWCIYPYAVQPDVPIFQTVLHDISADDAASTLYLLKVTPRKDQLDHCFIVDHVFHAHADYRGKDHEAPITTQVKQAYYNSKIPFATYYHARDAYKMPEVVCFCPFKPNQLEIVGLYHKPTLINMVREGGGFTQKPVKPLPSHEERKALANKRSRILKRVLERGV